MLHLLSYESSRLSFQPAKKMELTRRTKAQNNSKLDPPWKISSSSCFSIGESFYWFQYNLNQRISKLYISSSLKKKQTKQNKTHPCLQNPTQFPFHIFRCLYLLRGPVDRNRYSLCFHWYLINKTRLPKAKMVWDVISQKLPINRLLFMFISQNVLTHFVK